MRNEGNRTFELMSSPLLKLSNKMFLVPYHRLIPSFPDSEELTEVEIPAQLARLIAASEIS